MRFEEEHKLRGARYYSKKAAKKVSEYGVWIVATMTYMKAKSENKETGMLRFAYFMASLLVIVSNMRDLIDDINEYRLQKNIDDEPED